MQGPMNRQCARYIAVGEGIVMLSATKHLGPRVRSFAEFTLSEANVLRMTTPADLLFL